MDEGRDATSPLEIPLRGWLSVVIRTWRESAHDNVGLIARTPPVAGDAGKGAL